MSKETAIKYFELDDQIKELEAKNMEHKKQVVENTEAIKMLKLQKHDLLIELRPAFNMRPGPKPKVERKRRSKKVIEAAPES
jgi:hypothetical protein